MCVLGIPNYDVYNLTKYQYMAMSQLYNSYKQEYFWDASGDTQRFAIKFVVGSLQRFSRRSIGRPCDNTVLHRNNVLITRYIEHLWFTFSTVTHHRSKIGFGCTRRLNEIHDDWKPSAYLTAIRPRCSQSCNCWRPAPVLMHGQNDGN